MSRSTPESVFQLAQRAVAAGDWETFFTCLSARDLRRLATMLVPLAGVDPAARAICADHGISESSLDAVAAAGDAVVRSAQASHGSGRQLPAEMLEQSNRHRSLVKAHEATITAATREMTDLASFVAAIERHRRATSGGGSVSSSLFVDERLSDVTVAGARANARRHHRSGHEELLGFEQRRGEWQIVLFGRPGAR